MSNNRKTFISDVTKSLGKVLRNRDANVSSDDVMRFLNLGADPNANININYKVSNAARDAAKLPLTSLTALMLKFGALPFNGTKKSAIVSAAKMGHWDNVFAYKDLLIAKKERNDSDILGKALLHAVKDGSDKAYEAAVMLIEAGANVNYQKNVYYINRELDSSDEDEFSESEDYEPIVRENQTFSVNGLICLPTPLHLAMFKSDERMISLLIKHGASCNEGCGYTPVDIAEMNNDSKAVLFYYDEVKAYLDSQNSSIGLTSK